MEEDTGNIYDDYEGSSLLYEVAETHEEITNVLSDSFDVNFHVLHDNWLLLLLLCLLFLIIFLHLVFTIFR